MYYSIAEQFKLEELLVYLRKSRTDDTTLTVEEVLEKHENMLDEWAEKHFGKKVPEKNKFREVVSGEKIDDRPEIQRILKQMESPNIKGVLVVDCARLGRPDLEDIGRLSKLFKYTNTLVVTPMKTFDLRNDYDRDLFERELMRGNDYLEYVKRIMSNGRLQSVSQGNYIGSVAPYGFDKIMVTEGKRKCPTLKENKEQADVVRLIFDLYVNKDMGRNNICNYLHKLNIKPPKGDYWKPEVLHDMLCNIHYIGKVRWNWRKTITIVNDGEIVKTRPKSKIGEFLVYEGKHQGIVSEEIFNAAQEKLGRNHRAKPSTELRNPLASILFCKCGKAMIYRTHIDKEGNEKAKARLTCNNQKHCNNGSCTYDEMIDRVCEILRQCISDFEIRINENTSDSAKLHKKLIVNLEKKLKELEAKELSQWESQSDPDPEQRMPPEIFKMLNQKLLKEKEEVQQALCKAKESMPEPIDYKKKKATFQEALTALNNPEVSAQTKNTLLKACIERIEYSRERPQILRGDKRERRCGKWTSPPIEIDVKLKV